MEERLSRLSPADVKPAAEFIAYCLKVDLAKRPSALNLMDHSWLASGHEYMNVHVDSVTSVYDKCDEGRVRNPLNLYSTVYAFKWRIYWSGRKLNSNYGHAFSRKDICSKQCASGLQFPFR